jgi:hypothetical protein
MGCGDRKCVDGAVLSTDERHRLLSAAGLTDRKLAAIGAIAVLAAHTEHYAEKAIWEIEGPSENDGNPWTDGKPITALIDRLEGHWQTVTKPGLGDLIFEWCRGARPAFSCRNSILHGRTWAMGGEWSTFNRNELINGKLRKRSPKEFHATDHTLDLLEEAFEHLLNGIHLIGVAAQAKVPLGDTKTALSKLRKARSIADELDDLAAAYNHEKY